MSLSLRKISSFNWLIDDRPEVMVPHIFSPAWKSSPVILTTWKWLYMVGNGWHEMVVRCGEGIGSSGHDTGVQYPCPLLSLSVYTVCLTKIISLKWWLKIIYTHAGLYFGGGGEFKSCLSKIKSSPPITKVTSASPWTRKQNGIT